MLLPFVASLRVPGSARNQPIHTVSVTSTRGVTAGATSPSVWFPRHSKQPITCDHCNTAVGFRYTGKRDGVADAAPDGPAAAAAAAVADFDFDGLFFSALAAEEGATLRSGRLVRDHRTRPLTTTRTSSRVAGRRQSTDRWETVCCSLLS